MATKQSKPTSAEPQTEPQQEEPQQQPGEWTPALTEDFLDATTFEQLLDMDDDDEREFSKGIVWNYFEQVKGSFKPIEDGM
jgi:osomolarity two-component system, phosphorelay intermediate protein YPD1